MIVDTSNFIVNGNNNENVTINATSINIKAASGAEGIGVNITAGRGTLNISESNVKFNNTSLIVDTSNFIVNGTIQKAINITSTTGNIDISSTSSSQGAINLTSNGSTLTVTKDDVTFKGQSLINIGGGGSTNYVVNGDNNGEVNINTLNSSNINIKSGTSGSVNIASSGATLNVTPLNVNFTVSDSTLTITQDDVTFKGQSLINSGVSGNYVVNGQNSGGVNITAATGHIININSSGSGGVNINTGTNNANINSTGSINLTAAGFNISHNTK